MPDYGAMRLGKAAAVVSPETPRLRDVLPPTSQTVWPDADWRGDVADRIMGFNDRIGDCVVVASGNGVLVQSGYAGAPQRMTDDEAMANYIAATGYDAATGTGDTGLVIEDFLRRWNTVGITIAGQVNRLVGFAHVDPSDLATVRRAIGLGAGLSAGLLLPLLAQDQLAAGQPWDAPLDGGTGSRAARGSWGGHNVWVLSADPYGVWCVTWGQQQRVTWDAWGAWCDEAWLLVDPAFLDAQNFDPADLNVSVIQAAMPFARTP